MTTPGHLSEPDELEPDDLSELDDLGPDERPLLIGLRALAVLLDRSEASLARDIPAGRLPAPVWLGGSRKWRRKEIEDWVDCGCPLRTEWEELRRE